MSEDHEDDLLSQNGCEAMLSNLSLAIFKEIERGCERYNAARVMTNYGVDESKGEIAVGETLVLHAVPFQLFRTSSLLSENRGS